MGVLRPYLKVKSMKYAYCILIALYCCALICADIENSLKQERIRTMINNLFIQEDIAFENKAADVTLAGTFTKPHGKNKFPVVILIAGMGPNDRDYTMMGRKLFLEMAEYLTKRGIAVLRYDKRGVGKSTGEFSYSVTSVNLAEDVFSAISYLKTRADIDNSRIGLCGHSEGGLIATIVAARSKDVAFITLMAPAVGTNISSVIKQVGIQLKADGATDDLISLDSNIRHQILDIILQNNPQIAPQKALQGVQLYWNNITLTEQQSLAILPFAITLPTSESMIQMFNSPWYRFLLNFDIVDTLKQITVPVLAAYGSCDGITSASITKPILDLGLHEASNYTFIELQNMNHWFQICKRGALSEYAMIPGTISAQALAIFGDWICAKAKL